MPSNPIIHPRLPLSAKILFWFFLNVALLVAVFLLLFNAQFHFDLNWLLASNARQRIESMRDVITDSLNNTDPDDWDSVIEHYGTVYHVRLSLFDEDGNHLIGAVNEVPDEVHARLLPPPQPPLPTPRPSLDNSPGSSAPSASTQPGGPNDPARPRWRGRPLRDLVRTTGPTHYWLLVSLRLDNDQTGGPMRATLIADDTSLSMGGLIMDMGPWLKVGFGAIAFSVLFWFPLLRGIARSIGKMKQATGQIAQGRFDVRLTSGRRDELGELAESINQMAARLDGFVKGQKRFLGDIAHELCSPLAKLQMSLGIIENNANEKQMAYAKAALEKAGQISTLVNALLDFSKASFEAQSVKLRPVNIKDAVEKALAGEAAAGTPASDQATLDIPAGLTACADPELLIRALANLIRNAILHNEKVGKIIITGAKSGDSVTISIADCGTGIPEDELPKIFDAFYRLDVSRTRDTGGVGLGLTIVKTCVESCHGTVTARNRQPHGLEVIITLDAECPAPQG